MATFSSPLKGSLVLYRDGLSMGAHRCCLGAASHWKGAAHVARLGACEAPQLEALQVAVEAREARGERRAGHVGHQDPAVGIILVANRRFLEVKWREIHRNRGSYTYKYAINALQAPAPRLQRHLRPCPLALRKAFRAGKSRDTLGYTYSLLKLINIHLHSNMTLDISLFL